MTKDSLHERGRALEESFYEKMNQQLLRELKHHMSSAEEKQALSDASGIKNEQLLDHLLELNINVDTVAALSLVPLVAVAWADRVVDTRERKALLQAASESGLHDGDPAYKILEGWLENPPGPETMDAWKAYVESLKESLTSGGREALKDEVMTRAHKVAVSTGGLMGWGNKISEDEQAVLHQLEAAFD